MRRRRGGSGGGGGGGAPAAVPAALQPTLYSPLVQWALQGASETPSRVFNDRSGNGRSLTSGTATAAPDLISGQSAVMSANLMAAIPVLALAGAMTLTARVWSAGATLQVLLDVGNAGAVSNYILYRGAAGTLQYLPQSGVAVDSGIVVPGSAWSFISLRRASATEVTLGVGNTYTTATTVPPDSGTSGIVILGQVEGGSSKWLGAFADVCIWNKRLTDAELDVLRVTAMGSAA